SEDARAGFGRASVRARAAGVGGQRVDLLAPEAPPAFVALRDALALPADAALPVAAREDDPLEGRLRPGCLESRTRLQLAGRLSADADPETLQARLERCVEFHRPRDPLILLLGGPDQVASATDEDLGLARALW